jgi:chitinase
MKITGDTYLTFGIGGVADVDITRVNKGNPAWSSDIQHSLITGSNVVVTGGNPSAVVSPYYEIIYEMGRYNASVDSEGTDFSSVAGFNGRMETVIISDLGNSTVRWPIKSDSTLSRKKDIIEIPSSNVLYDTHGGGGIISLGVKVNIGLELQLRHLPQFNYLEEGKVSYTCCDFPNG